LLVFCDFGESEDKRKFGAVGDQCGKATNIEQVFEASFAEPFQDYDADPRFTGRR